MLGPYLTVHDGASLHLWFTIVVAPCFSGTTSMFLSAVARSFKNVSISVLFFRRTSAVIGEVQKLSAYSAYK